MIPTLVFAGIACLVLGYVTYGRLLSRWLAVDETATTPAHTQRDGQDFLPARRLVLLGHHFSSIAGAGPIVGPVLAAAAFGWLPAVLWVVLGSIFIGGVQDFGSLMASVRHRACSVAEVARTEVSPLARLLFLVFVFFALVYVIVVFVDLTASTFATDPGVASSSGMYVVLAVVLGLSIYRLKMPFGAATLVYVPLMFGAIWAGQQLPLELPGTEVATNWSLILLAYCFIASVLPVWILLQPRDYLSSFLLYGCLAGGLGGILLGGGNLPEGGEPLQAFIGWVDPTYGPLFPALFITIACGAASGFHSIVASGTTAKQLDSERDAKPVAYGGMLLEGALALMAIGAVILVQSEGGPAASGTPAQQFAAGLGGFTTALGIDPGVGMSFGLLAVSTFLLTTLDSCTRLARYVLEELLAKGKGNALRSMGMTALVLVLPLILVFVEFTDAAGNPIPAYKAIWPVFGSTNQLLGALALMVITAWLRNQNRPRLFAAVPMVFMFWISTISLYYLAQDTNQIPMVRIVAGALLTLAVVLLVEGLRHAVRPRSAPA